MLAWFGWSGSVSQPAVTMQRATGVDAQPGHGVTLQSPRYLVGSRRAALIHHRHIAASMTA